MNSFTFLTNNPPFGSGVDVHLGSRQPDVVVREPAWRSGSRDRPRHDLAERHLPNARRTSGASIFSGRSGAVPRSIWFYVGSITSHLDRSFFNNAPQPGPGAVDPRRPSQKFKSRRIIQNDLITTTMR